MAMKAPETDEELRVIAMGQISNLSLTSSAPYDTCSVPPARIPLAGAAELADKGVWLWFCLGAGFANQMAKGFA